MERYKRILVTTDFSDINRVAVERAAILAQQDKSELIVLHVVEHFPYDGPFFSAMPQNFKPDDIMAQQVRGKMKELLDSHPLNVRYCSTPGIAIDQGYDRSMELTHSITMGFFNEQNRNKKLE